MLPLLRCAPGGFRLPPRRLLGAALTGCCASFALVAYLLGTPQLLAVAVPLSSLHPVLLGLTVLRERLSGRQMLGLLGTGIAVALRTAG